MANEAVLVDSSFLYVLYNPQEPKHSPSFSFVEASSFHWIIPDVVLTEVAYLFKRFGGERAVVTFLEILEKSRPHLEPVAIADLSRTREIIASYPGARLDFVDATIMALSERMNITKVCTFDRRDFPIFRPRHCVALELLP